MCIFCNTNELNIIYQDEYVYVIKDKYPVSTGHSLIITKRHIDNYFELTIDEKKSIDKVLMYLKEVLDKELNPDGYNIGINNKEASGQTIFHLHVHLIPRYIGDMENPQGGVRGVIPDKQKY